MSQSPTALKLCTTAELVDYYALYLGSMYDREELERAISAAINALYENRDSGGNMHSAGAACAAAALQAARGEEPL
jgi:hypothetical protein